MGPNYSISTACATSNFCILNAANHIIRGEAVSFRSPVGPFDLLLSGFCVLTICSHMQDVMLCGGSDAAIIPIGSPLVSLCSLEATHLCIHTLRIH